MEGVRHGTFADAHPPRENLSFQEKCWKGVPKSSPGSIFPQKTTHKTYMGAQSTKSRIYCFSYSSMVAAISRRIFRCFEKVVRSRPDRPTNAIAQPDRPDIDRKKLHRPARSTSSWREMPREEGTRRDRRTREQRPTRESRDAKARRAPQTSHC